MANARTSCDYCGGSVRWVPLDENKRRLYDVAEDGQPRRQHNCSDPRGQHAPFTPAAGARGGAPAPMTPTHVETESERLTREAQELARAADRARTEAEEAARAEVERLERERIEAERIAAEEEAARAAEANHEVAVSYDSTPKDRDGTGSEPPSVNGKYQISRFTYRKIMRLINRVERTHVPSNLGLRGPAGSGKSTLGVQIAAIRRAMANGESRPLFVTDMASKQTADECLTETTGIDQATGLIKVQPSALVRGIETPNATVVINDVALLQSPKVQNGLNELLDPSTRETFVPLLGRVVRVAEGVIIIGTWNEGSEYNGMSDIGLQLIDRFKSGGLIEIPYPERDQLVTILESQTGLARVNCERLANAAGWLRADPEPVMLSVRALIQAAWDMIDGATVAEALMGSCFGDMPVDEISRVFGILSVQSGRSETTELGMRHWQAPNLSEYGDLDCIGASGVTS